MFWKGFRDVFKQFNSEGFGAFVAIFTLASFGTLILYLAATALRAYLP